MFTQEKKNVYDLIWNNENIEYREVFHQSEKEFSAYNFEFANTNNLFKIFDMLEDEAKSLIEKKNVYDLIWNNENVEYREVFHQSEKEFSAYNFDYANTENLFKMFDMFEGEAKSLVEKKISLPAYDQCLKASHIFNLLDARGVIGVAERTGYIARIRELAKGCGALWLRSQG